MPERTVYLIDELRLDGDRVACRYAVAFVTSAPDLEEWHAIVYDPADPCLADTSHTFRFFAKSRDGARLEGHVTHGQAETSVGAEYLAGVGPLVVRGQGSRPVILGPADKVSKRHISWVADGAGRLRPAHRADDAAEWATGQTLAAIKMSTMGRPATRIGLAVLCALALWGGVAAALGVWRIVRDDEPSPPWVTSVSSTASPTASVCVAATSVSLNGRRVSLRAGLMIRERSPASGLRWTFVLFEPVLAAGQSLEGRLDVRVKGADGRTYKGPAWVDHATPDLDYVRLTANRP